MIQDLFPPSTRVNRIVPKRTFIDKLGANARMKEHFTRDVVSIEWFAKLAPSTLNMVDGLDVHNNGIIKTTTKTKNNKYKSCFKLSLLSSKIITRQLRQHNK